MSQTWTITKRDFLSYFKVPMGWVLCALYAIVSGFYFSIMLNYNYVDASAVLKFMRGLFFVLIPLLTMRAFAVEKKNGTEILYATSSVSSGQYVIAKYISSSLVFLCISAVNILYIFTTLGFNGVIDIRYWGTLIAYLLTGLTYIAIGLFTSSLTSNQIIAAAVSFVIFVAFEIFGSISTSIGSAIKSLVNTLDFNDNISAAREASIGQAVTDALNWLNPSTKLEGFYDGTFDILSIIYFISLSIIFLFITKQIIESTRWKK